MVSATRERLCDLLLARIITPMNLFFCPLSMREETATEFCPPIRRSFSGPRWHRAVELLRAGQVVALPTETVYGLRPTH